MIGTEFGSAFQYLISDRLVNEGETILQEVIFTGSGSGVQVTIYEGLDPDSGRIVAVLNGVSGVATEFDFPDVQLDRGLYIDLGTGVSSLSVFYLTQRFQ